MLVLFSLNWNLERGKSLWGNTDSNTMSQMCHIHFRSCFTKKPNFSQGKICQNTCFLWPLLSDIRRENTGRRKPVIRHVFQNVSENQKQPSRGVLRRRCSANIYQIYRRAPMPKCNFNKDAKQLYWNHNSAMGVLL